MSVKHIVVAGITQSGKTYNSFKEVLKNKNHTIFYNVKRQPIEVLKKSQYITLDNSATVRKLNHSRKYYKMINFIPSDNPKEQEREIKALCQLAMQNKNTSIIWDECYQYLKQGTYQSEIFTIARRGASENVQNILLCQSIADIDKKAVKQCEIIKIFKLNDWDYRYINSIGFDGEKIKEILKNAKKYSYVELSNGEMKLIQP